MNQHDPLANFSGPEQDAANWLARIDRGLNAAEQGEFENWLARDRQHFEIFSDVQQTWSLLDDARPLRRARRRRSWPVLAAAAAAIVLGFAAWQFPWSRDTGTEIAAASPRRMERLELPDGSEVRLNADSRVEVAFTASERRVALVRGEAHFTVTRNPQRPFIVEAQGVSVRAVGTAFNVKLDAQSVEVLVTSGRVRVDDGEGVSLLPEERAADSGLLVAGERTVIAMAAPVEQPGEPAAPVPVKAPEIQPVAADEIRRALAWQEQRIEFVAAPLTEIVAQFNARNRHQLVIADAALAAQRFGGSFDANDPATLVRLLEADFGVISEVEPHRTVLRSRPD
jgi:transmembrane sensor